MKTAVAFAATLMAACVLPAQAQKQAQASASLSHDTLTLIDLAPADGPAPSLTWTDSYQWQQAYVWQTADGTPTTLLDGGDHQGEGTLTAAAQGASTFSRTGQSDAGTFAHAGEGVAANGWANLGGSFSLSPHTELVLQWVASVDASDSASNRARADLTLRGVIFENADGHSQEVMDALHSYGEGSFTRPMSLQLLSGAKATRGFYGAMAWSQAVAAVPEPQAWALLAAGTGLLARRGAARWRRS